MKTFLLYSLILMIVVGCGSPTPDVEGVIESKDLTKIRAARQQILLQYDALGASLKKLDEAVSLLDSTSRVPLVTTFTVVDTVFNHYIDIQGNVETKQNIIIYPEYTGVLKKTLVREGQQVSKGQLLAVIDDGGLAQQLQQAKTQAALAQTTFERQKRLWDQKIGSEIQFLQAKTNMEAQQELVNQLAAQLAKTQVKAPFSGVIDDVITDQGQVVMNGQSPLIRLVNMDDMYVKAEIPENYLVGIKWGNAVKLNIPSLGKNFDGTIRQVGNFINPNNRSFTVEITINSNDSDLKPNQIAKLLINDYTNPHALLIPENLIKETALGEKVVFVTKSGTAGNKTTVEEKKLTLGKTSGAFVEVLEGLTTGQIIVAEGSKALRDGQQVEIK
ncbi:MAG: efflux RND transporter periplasmic adaptor subunit [Flavobacteriaceae bacterium]|nr:efflux RND transporter periplasmic adaptor subunit [Flavobacteriaceae bacterium]